MLIHKAIEFAAIAHKNQLRKSKTVPYIVHLFETAIILAKNGASDEVVVAGILHDTLEDTATTKQDLLEAFGEKITSLVCASSENKTLSWEERKQETIDFIKNEATQEELMVLCADKIANARSLYIDQQNVGDNVLWTRFNRSYEQQKWYYENLANALQKLNNKNMVDELSYLVKQIFQK